MTENEYCNVSDLVILRNMKDMLRNLNCFNDPNKSRRMSITANIDLMITDIDNQIEVD